MLGFLGFHFRWSEGYLATMTPLYLYDRLSIFIVLGPFLVDVVDGTTPLCFPAIARECGYGLGDLWLLCAQMHVDLSEWAPYDLFHASYILFGVKNVFVFLLWCYILPRFLQLFSILGFGSLVLLVAWF